MTLFWAIAAALTVAALLFLLPPLMRRRTTAPDTRVAANAAIYREQLEELTAELRRGALTEQEFERQTRRRHSRSGCCCRLPSCLATCNWATPTH